MRLFRLSPGEGSATEIGPLTHENVRAIAVEPATGRLYGVDTITNQLLLIDTATARESIVAELATDWRPFIGSLAFEPVSGALHGLDYRTGTLIRIGTRDGSIERVRHIPGAPGRRGAIAFAADGTLYVADADTDLLHRLDPVSGKLVAVGSVEPLDHVTGLTFDPRTGTLWAADSNARSIARLDTGGEAPSLLPAHEIRYITGLAVGPVAGE